MDYFYHSINVLILIITPFSLFKPTYVVNEGGAIFRECNLTAGTVLDLSYSCGDMFMAAGGHSQDPAFAFMMTGGVVLLLSWATVQIPFMCRHGCDDLIVEVIDCIFRVLALVALISLNTPPTNVTRTSWTLEILIGCIAARILQCVAGAIIYDINNSIDRRVKEQIAKLK